MKRFSVLLLVLCYYLSAWTQKKIIDKKTIDHWVSLQETDGRSAIISNDGKYVVYQYGSLAMGTRTVVQGLHTPYSLEFANASMPAITENSRHFVLKIGADTLMLLALGKSQPQYIANVSTYRLPEKGNGQWLAYQENGDDETVVLINLVSGLTKSYMDVSDFWFDKNGAACVLKCDTNLLWIDLASRQEQVVPGPGVIKKVAIDNAGAAIAFMVTDTSGDRLLYIRKGDTNARVVAGEVGKIMETGFYLHGGQIGFSADDKKIYYQRRRILRKDQTDYSSGFPGSATIWSYLGPGLLGYSGKTEDSEQRQYWAVVNLVTNKIIPLETDELDAIGVGAHSSCPRHFVLLSTRRPYEEEHWTGQTKSYYIVNAETGEKKLVVKNAYPALTFADLSPAERFVNWYDGHSQQYFAFETATGKTRCISSSIPVPLRPTLRGEADKIAHRIGNYGVAAWLHDDDGLLIYDRTDIWKVDPAGLVNPKNITNGYGQRNDITFRLAPGVTRVITGKEKEFLLTALNNQNKQNGFFKAELNGDKDPVVCTLGNYVYFFVPRFPLLSATADAYADKFAPQQAKYSPEYVVRRMSGTEAPNLFYTTDFKTFRPLTNFSPQKTVNWIVSSLHTWTLPDGQRCDGILHVPENFDSKQLYPVIFNYYEQRSEGLNIFRSPELAGHNISIPWYVSRGYLVFEPDIYYKTGKTASCIRDVLVSAAEYLGRKAFVDPSRMGLQGQSFGGYETNVVVTGTTLFAAACEMAGPSDLVGEYLGHSPMSADILQRNLAVAPWENPMVYVDNSPVFHVDKVTTPLLIVHNREDDAIPFFHAKEMFMALRRAGKKVWLIEYNGEGHAIYDEKNKLDYTLRMQQFFDHYLKGNAAPAWMTEPNKKY